MSYLERIKEKEKDIDALLQIDEEGALKQAEAVDSLISKGGELPLLSGVPATVKDVILIKDSFCTAGSKILENYKAPYSATCVERLKKEKVIFLGKTNCDEFAMGSSTEHSAFKTTKNPHLPSGRW